MKPCSFPTKCVSCHSVCVDLENQGRITHTHIGQVLQDMLLKIIYHGTVRSLRPPVCATAD